MLHLLAARQLVKPASPKAGSTPSWAPRLRDVSAGHWVGGESQQRCYSRDEWARLVQLLQSPQPLGEVRTLPDDDPLAVKALLLLPAAGVLLCACHNDSMLDALEHSLDPTAAVDRPAGDGARDAGALAVRPLGALLAYTAAGKAAGARRASATLRAAASALAYCASQQLVLVGSRSGAVLLYAHGADWEALTYRFAVEAHASPVAAMMLRPMGADVGGGGGGGEDDEGGGEEAGEDGGDGDDDSLLLVAGEQADVDGAAGHVSALASPVLFGYDLKRLCALPVIAPVDEPLSALAGEQLSAAAARGAAPRILAGTPSGALWVLAPEVCDVPAAAAPAAAPPPPKQPLEAAPAAAAVGGVAGLSIVAAGALSGVGRAAAGPPAAAGGGGETALLLHCVQREPCAHAAAVTAVVHCEARGIAVSGAADGSIHVWSLAPRGLEGAAAAGGLRREGRLLLRAAADAPSPRAPPRLGAVASLHVSVTADETGGSAVRVVASDGSGVHEWDLRGGDVCRSLRPVRSGAAATAIDARTGALWVGGNAGEVQAWRWPPPARRAARRRAGTSRRRARQCGGVRGGTVCLVQRRAAAGGRLGVAAVGRRDGGGGSQPPRGEDETPRASGKKVEKFEAEAAVSDEMSQKILPRETARRCYGHGGAPRHAHRRPPVRVRRRGGRATKRMRAWWAARRAALRRPPPPRAARRCRRACRSRAAWRGGVEAVGQRAHAAPCRSSPLASKAGSTGTTTKGGDDVEAAASEGVTATGPSGASSRSSGGGSSAGHCCPNPSPRCITWIRRPGASARRAGVRRQPAVGAVGAPRARACCFRKIASRRAAAAARAHTRRAPTRRRSRARPRRAARESERIERRGGPLATTRTARTRGTGCLRGARGGIGCCIVDARIAPWSAAATGSVRTTAIAARRGQKRTRRARQQVRERHHALGHRRRARRKASAMPTDYMVAGAPTFTDAPRAPDAHFVREGRRAAAARNPSAPKFAADSGSTTANVATAPASADAARRRRLLPRRVARGHRAPVVEGVAPTRRRAGVQTERPRVPPSLCGRDTSRAR